MTITWPNDVVSDQARPNAWHPVLSSSAAGVAVAVTLTDRLRLVVLDLADPDSRATEVVGEVNRSSALTAAELADDLVVEHLDESRCSSVAIADLFRDGTVDLQVRNGPPGVLLSPDSPARLLPGGTTVRVATGEVMLLCSASFLEDPPVVLGTVRQSLSDDTSLARLRQALKVTPDRGAIASVTAWSP